jgi:hypothetical protein
MKNFREDVMLTHQSAKQMQQEHPELMPQEVKATVAISGILLNILNTIDSFKQKAR